MTFNKVLRIITLVGIFLIPFIALIVNRTGFFPFITGKNFAFRLIVELIFGAWLILALRDPVYRPKKSWIFFAILGLVVWMIIPNTFGLNPTKSFWSNFERMEGWVTLVHLVAYFIVIGSVLNTEKIWRWFWNTSIAVSIVIAIYGLFQLAGKIVINQGGDRLDATLGNATYLAGYMLFHIFITLFLLFRREGKHVGWKIFYVVALGLQVFTLYHTATRGAILGLIGGVLVSAILAGFFAENKIRIKKFVIALVVAMVLVGGTFFAFRSSSVVQNSTTLYRLANISLEDKTTQSRFIMWGIASKGFLERPLLGYGQGNFNYVFNKNYDPRMFDQEQWFDRAHNIFFEWLIAGGILGLLLYISILLSTLAYIWKTTNFGVTEKSILTGLLVSYAFHNFFVFDQIISYSLFFSFLAFLHYKNAKPFVSLENKNTETGLRDRVLVPLIIIVTLATPYFVNAKAFNQNKVLIQALQQPETKEGIAKSTEIFREVTSGRYASAIGLAEAREQLTSAMIRFASVKDTVAEQTELYDLTKSELEKQIKLTPEDARYHLMFGSFLSRFRQNDEARVELARAQELSPRKQTVIFEQAQLELQSGNKSDALKFAKEAYEIEKRSDEAWRIYVTVALLAEDKDLYNKLLAEASQNGEYRRIILLLESQIVADPANYQLKMNLAATYFKFGKKERSIDTIREVVEAYPLFKEQGEDLIRRIEAGENPLTE